MNKWLRAFLLLLQIGGGILGFVIIGRALWKTEQSQVTVMFNAAFLAVFAFGILAGIALIKKPVLGLVLSLIFQGIQIPLFASSAVSYNMFSGAFFNVYWYDSGWRTDFAFLASRFHLYLDDERSLFLGVNILALVLSAFLIRELWRYIARLRAARFAFADTPDQHDHSDQSDPPDQPDQPTADDSSPSVAASVTGSESWRSS